MEEGVTVPLSREFLKAFLKICMLVLLICGILFLLLGSWMMTCSPAFLQGGGWFLTAAGIAILLILVNIICHYYMNREEQEKEESD